MVKLNEIQIKIDVYAISNKKTNVTLDDQADGILCTLHQEINKNVN